MKKATTLFAAILLLAVGATAQKLSYQAVVRNNANELVTETTVQVAVTVLNANNAVQYAETHANVQTNRNGLLSLMIGDGVPTGSATLAGVEWPGASLRTVITLPDNTTITNVTPVNSVPYVLYAGNINPNMVSAAIADYIASHSIGGENNVQADWNETNQNSDAFIRNKPNIPTIPMEVTAFANDAGYLTEAQCNGMDICSLLNTVAALQQQVADLQTQLDSVGLIVDTAITHLDFHCGVSTVTDADDNEYETVQIGAQCWTKTNLRSTKAADGTAIAAGGSDTSTTVAYRYYPGNSSSNVSAYGYLYNWAAAKLVCPAGWHLPSDAEWTVLTDYVSSQSEYTCGGDNSYIAKALASTEGWNTSSATCAVGNNQSRNNATGFSAVPAGFYGGGSGYPYLNFCSGADFWSATQSDNLNAYDRNLYYIENQVRIFNYSKSRGYSVRCLRD